MTINTTLQALIDSHDQPFVLIDESYAIVAANSAYQSAYGVNASQVVGRACYEVSHKLNSPCWQHGEACPHRAAFEEGRGSDLLHLHYDPHGREEQVQVKGYVVPQPDGQRLMGERLARLGQVANNKQAGANEGPTMRDVEASYLAELLQRYSGHRRSIAQAMGISERTLYRKLRRYGFN
ncbi:MAG: hypothetical protein AMJ84_06905 [Acidithiobacillales bacterium SM23_46]|jgi:transcriptional regulator with PAS, ATPase and Fis domain|nr:MAG: hypothetical protein AMJ84_06905 [Acidithiobacillales bacterium SM23_46]